MQCPLKVLVSLMSQVKTRSCCLDESCPTHYDTQSHHHFHRERERGFVECRALIVNGLASGRKNRTLMPSHEESDYLIDYLNYVE